MKATLTKLFYFSASYAAGKKIHAHNYTLGITVDALEEDLEGVFEKKVDAALIQKLHSRDLKEDVDFLKGVKITDLALLQIFWRVLEKEIMPIALRSLFLERNQRTRVVLSSEPS